MLGTRQTARLAQALPQPEATLLVLSTSTDPGSGSGSAAPTASGSLPRQALELRERVNAPAERDANRVSELESGAGVHHRSPPSMNGGDDLLRVDPLEVGAGGREVRVPELALDQRQWDPFMEQLDSVGMAELMRGKAPPDTGIACDPPQLDPNPAG
jgi:hypothetical protein